MGWMDGWWLWLCVLVSVSAFQRILINNKEAAGQGRWPKPKDKLRFVYVKQKSRIFQRTVTGFPFHGAVEPTKLNCWS